MNNPIRNSYNNIPLFQSPLNELLHYSYININECKAVMQSNEEPDWSKKSFCGRIRDVRDHDQQHFLTTESEHRKRVDPNALNPYYPS